ncbi:MAG TPA: SapC family protein [Steroidobacter sp.]|uniref:SapC family protein n=1 Tax=Steroidobacter sp. TaxID=1978227 RepID=UPI002ED8D7B1
MATHELLNPQDHAHLRLLPRQGAEPHFVQIVPGEFVSAAVACPVLFSKDPATGAFYAGAALGLKPGEGALKSTQDRGGFEPLALQRDGFFIAEDRIAIDRSNPRFSETEGEPLFDSAQQPSTALRRIQRALRHLHEGIAQTAALVRELMDLKLIEPIDISLSFDNGERLTLEGLYTVSRDALRDLPDADVLRLFRTGHLQLAYAMTGSLNQLPVLAHLRNRRLADSR